MQLGGVFFVCFAVRGGPPKRVYAEGVCYALAGVAKARATRSTQTPDRQDPLGVFANRHWRKGNLR